MRGELASLSGILVLGLLGLVIILTHTDGGAIVGVIGAISAIVGVNYGSRITKQ